MEWTIERAARAVSDCLENHRGEASSTRCGQPELASAIRRAGGRGQVVDALRFYAEGRHVGVRDSSDMRVDGDEYVRDRGEVARAALEAAGEL